MLISVTVRSKPKKNISSVTTTPELERRWQFSSDSSVISALPGEKCNNYVQYSQLEPDEGPTTLRTKLYETNFMIPVVNHMTTDQLQHRKLSYWQQTILALQFTEAESRLVLV